MALALLFGIFVCAGPTPQVVWDAPEECPREESLLDALRAHAPAGATSLSVRAVVRRVNVGFEVEITTGTAATRGVRVVHTATCEEAVKAVAAVVSIALSEVGPHRAPLQVLPLPGPSPSVSNTPTETPRADGQLALAAGVVVGLLPSPAVDLSMTGSLAYRLARVELAVSAVLPQRQSAGVGFVDYGAVATQLCAGAGFRRAEFELDVCAGVNATLLWAAGTGYPGARGGSALALAVMLGGRLQRALLGNLSASLAASLDVAVVRPRFAFEGQPAAHAVEPVCGHFLLGLAWAFP